MQNSLPKNLQKKRRGASKNKGRNGGGSNFSINSWLGDGNIRRRVV